MKSIFVPVSLAVSVTLFGATLAVADPAAPAITDPLTAILTPVGNALNVVVQPVLVTPINAVTPIIAPPPPPAPAAPVQHLHRHRHHRLHPV